MKVAVITCGRSDYSIYRPLLKKMEKDSFFDLRLIVGGTHLSAFYGYTVNAIRDDGFRVDGEIESLVLGDSSEAISSAIGLTALKFSSFWKKKDYDLVFCLGDRYEMFAAISAALPFNLPVAHIHGGETTLGAIDNKFRHSITQMSDIHFVSAEPHADKVRQITGSDESVFNVGSLSLDNLAEIELLSTEKFTERFGIDMSKPTILVTFHPETVNPERNREYIETLSRALEKVSEQVLITMPNADTMGGVIRERVLRLEKENTHIFARESLGLVGYFSALKHCSVVLGNSSSGIIEAASFKKYVIDLGDRQKGRFRGSNVINIPIDEGKILEQLEKTSQLPAEEITNVYDRGGAADLIIEALKNRFNG